MDWKQLLSNVYFRFQKCYSSSNMYPSDRESKWGESLRFPFSRASHSVTCERLLVSKSYSVHMKPICDLRARNYTVMALSLSHPSAFASASAVCVADAQQRRRHNWTGFLVSTTVLSACRQDGKLPKASYPREAKSVTSWE